MSVIETQLTRMPRLGLGTWPMRGTGCQRAVEAALGLGYRHIDTAKMYGNEAEVGAAIAASGLPRDDIYLTTKIWNDKTDGHALRRAFDACLKRLATRHVDLLLIHWPSAAMQLDSLLGGLATIRAEGAARAVGVANFPPGLLAQALSSGIAPLACNQVEHHLYLAQPRLRAACAAAGMVLTSYTPMAKGAVTEDAVVRRIAAAHGATPGQVALAYLLAMPGVAAIPKAASPARQAENLAALDLVLSDAERAELATRACGRRLVSPGFVHAWED